MKNNIKSRQLVRLSNDELRKSRIGTLGRFPPPELYEPEDDENGKRKEAPERQRQSKMSEEHGNSRV
jgi:hypothetical protein